MYTAGDLTHRSRIPSYGGNTGAPGGYAPSGDSYSAGGGYGAAGGGVGAGYGGGGGAGAYGAGAGGGYANGTGAGGYGGGGAYSGGGGGYNNMASAYAPPPAFNPLMSSSSKGRKRSGGGGAAAAGKALLWALFIALVMTAAGLGAAYMSARGQLAELKVHAEIVDQQMLHEKVRVVVCVLFCLCAVEYGRVLCQKRKGISAPSIPVCSRN